MSLTDKFRPKEPEPLYGEMVGGQVEVQFSGKKKWTYFGFAEKTTAQWDYKGKHHTINIYRLMAKKNENAVTLCSIDADLVTDSEPISYGETNKGMKGKTRLMGSLMIIIDFLVMYFLYLLGSSGFSISYDPQAMDMFTVLIAAIIMAFAVLIMYLWYSSKVTVFSIEVQPMSSKYQENLAIPLPVILINNQRIPLEEYLSELLSEPVEEFLHSLSEFLQTFNSSIVEDLAAGKARLEDAYAHEKSTRARESSRLIDTRFMEYDRTVVYRSWVPVFVSVIVLVVGFVILYFVFG